MAACVAWSSAWRMSISTASRWSRRTVALQWRGARLKAVAAEAKRHCLSGLEFLEGIPGSVGGALRMNAGAMGGATFDVVESVWFMDGEGRIVEKPTAELPVEYRACPLFKTNIALGAVRGTAAPREQIEARLNDFNAKRWSSQPAMPSAGCTFKNPEPARRASSLMNLD